MTGHSVAIIVSSLRAAIFRLNLYFWCNIFINTLPVQIYSPICINSLSISVHILFGSDAYEFFEHSAEIVLIVEPGHFGNRLDAVLS